MKTVKILLAVITAAMLVMFSSCKKEAPTISFNPDGVNVNLTDPATMTQDLEVTFEAEAGIKTINVTKSTYDVNDKATLDESYTPEELSGFDGEKSWVHTFNLGVTESEFTPEVAKIVFEFEVIDKKDASDQKMFTFWAPNRYTITFNVTDGENALKDATVKLGDESQTTGENGNCSFQRTNGTYNYTVELAGYTTKTGTVTVDTAAVNENVVLTKSLSEWQTIMLVKEKVEYTYDNDGVNITGNSDESTVIGFKCGTNPNNRETRIEKTDNCEGWVKVDATADFTSYKELEDAYTAGEVITFDKFEFDEAKGFSERRYISKVDGNYVFVALKKVKHVKLETDVYRNIRIFDYKTKN